jgi:hypothetical protein
VTVRNGYFKFNETMNARGGAIWANDALNLTGTTLDSNTAINGDGGAAFANGASVVERVKFVNNQSGGNGGALLISNTLTLSNTLLIGNFATNGGGLYQEAGGGRIVNSLFAGNLASSHSGMALYLKPTGTLQLLFTTVAAPTLTSGDAISVFAGNVQIQDTVVTNHTTGLFRQGGTVFQDYNLFFGNTLSIFGATSGGTHNAVGDPLFVNPSSDNYHLRLGSAALNVGLDTGVYTDIDGQVRPYGAGFDIGYDELSVVRLYMPLIRR